VPRASRDDVDVNETAVNLPTAVMRRFLGEDRPRDLLRIVVAVVGFAVLDRLVRAGSTLAAADEDAAVLVVAAVTRNWVAVLPLAGAIGLVAVAGGKRTRAGWSSMDHGAVWRLLTIPSVVTIGWYGATADYNYLLGRWNAVDRLLIVILAVAAVAHPLLLVPFVFQAQTLLAQWAIPFGGTTTLGVDRLATVAILVIAVTFLLAIASAEPDTSPGLLLLGMAVAADFFVPGRGKLGLDWLTTTHLDNFAYSSYTTGWRGAGDGTWARSIASLMRTFEWPLLIGTTLLEIGAVVAVFHRKLLRWWLPGWILLHISIFLVSGFWLIAWVVVELGLVIILWRRDLAAWTSLNDTPARGALAAVVVVAFGSTVFSPPSLAWLDAPVSYGYEVEVVGESGTRYHVPLDAFGVAQQDLVFLFARFTDFPPAVAGYGATAGGEYYARLSALDDFAELRALERTLDPVSEHDRAASERLITSWFDAVNAGISRPWFLVAPPGRFWVSRPDPTFDMDEDIVAAEVVLVRSLHDDDTQRFDRETVLRVEVGADGKAAVTSRSGTG
jgi:hypothetical protein